MRALIRQRSGFRNGNNSYKACDFITPVGWPLMRLSVGNAVFGHQMRTAEQTLVVTSMQRQPQGSLAYLLESLWWQNGLGGGVRRGGCARKPPLSHENRKCHAFARDPPGYT